MVNETIHNPDQYMTALRTIISGGRKKIGLLIGAGAPAGMRKINGFYPLIPAVDGLTTEVLTLLRPKYGTQINELLTELAPKRDIETFLSRVRSLAKVIGNAKIHDLDGEGYNEFGGRICERISKIVNVNLPAGTTAYTDIVTWIVGTARDHAIEIFTTNYDLLMEEALERVRAPYFDGFTGGREPFFDPVTVSSNDLPRRWTCFWKLHGSNGLGYLGMPTPSHGGFQTHKQLESQFTSRRNLKRIKLKSNQIFANANTQKTPINLKHRI